MVAADGKELEWKFFESDSWSQFDQENPTWDFTNFNYRIKPILAKPREWRVPAGKSIRVERFTEC